MEFVIDGKNMLDRRSAHEEIARALRFPDYYGHNLDALFDLISTFEGKVVIKNVSSALNAMGAYALSILKTFMDAQETNRFFTITFE